MTGVNLAKSICSAGVSIQVDGKGKFLAFEYAAATAPTFTDAFLKDFGQFIAEHNLHDVLGNHNNSMALTIGTFMKVWRMGLQSLPLSLVISWLPGFTKRH
jgi:hypothetical protein